jgi:HK97 gp10 family phage protein
MTEIVHGMNEFLANLRELELSQRQEVLTIAAKAGAKVATDALQRAAPVDTGRVRDGIVARVSGKDSDFNEVTVDVKPNKKAFYWFFTNTGTVHIRGTHWSDRAIESVRSRVQEAMTGIMLKAIEKVLR